MKYEKYAPELREHLTHKQIESARRRAKRAGFNLIDRAGNLKHFRFGHEAHLEDFTEPVDRRRKAGIEDLLVLI